MEKETVDRAEFLEAFGITEDQTNSTEETTDNVTESNEEQTSDSKTNVEGSESSEGSEGTHEEGTTEEQNDTQSVLNARANNAFAEMRVTNRRQRELLGKVASVLGLDTNNTTEDALLSAVENAVTRAQARQQGIPESVLQRLNTLEAVNQKYNRDQAYLAAGRGIQQIKTEFGASQKDLEGFMAELAKDGINPFENQVNLVNEYKLRNFDKIIQAKTDAAVLAEQQRAAKASDHSTTPSNAKSSDSTEEKPINSLSELNAWLAKNAK